jgi:hypothetical protein
MSWGIAAAYFGMAWVLVLPAWDRKSLIVLALLVLALFPVVFAAATISNPNPSSEYVSLPALLIGAVGLPVLVLTVIGRGMSLGLDRRLRRRDERHD